MKPVPNSGRSTLFVALALAAGVAQAQAPARIIAPESAAEEGAKGAEQARIEVTGKIQTDFIYDFNRVNPDWNMTLRPSQIPINCPGDPGCGKDGETIFSVRQTQVQFKGFIPTKVGELRTELSLDLFQPQSASTAFRLLNAWATLGNWGIGQYYSLFMNIDVFPNTIDYWGPAGMTFIRNPQIRYTAPFGEGMKLALSLESPGAAIDTGKVALAEPAWASRAARNIRTSSRGGASSATGARSRPRPSCVQSATRRPPRPTSIPRAPRPARASASTASTTSARARTALPGSSSTARASRAT